MTLYSLSDIRKHLDSGDFSRGRDYHKKGKVIEANLSQKDGTITGKVSGSGRNKYTQVIKIENVSGSVKIKGSCSCPVGSNCKHVAAVLMTMLDKQSKEKTQDKVREKNYRSQNVELSAQVMDWLKAFDETAQQKADPNSFPDEINHRLIYLLHPGDPRAHGVEKMCHIKFMSVRLLKNGDYGKGPKAYNIDNVINYSAPKYLRPIDMELIHELLAYKKSGLFSGSIYAYPLPKSSRGIELLNKILSTGRCRFQKLSGSILNEGPIRKAQLEWHMTAFGKQKVHVNYENVTENGEDNAPDAVLPLSSPFYIDENNGFCGKLDFDLPEDIVPMIVSAPAVNTAEASKIVQALGRFGRDRKLVQDIPLPQIPEKKVIKKVKPTPCLELFSGKLKYDKNAFWQPGRGYYYYGQSAYEEITVPLARLSFDYDSIALNPEESVNAIERIEGDTLLSIPRDRKTEKKVLKEIAQHSFKQTKLIDVFTTTKCYASDYYLLHAQEDKQDASEVLADEFFDSQRFINFSMHELPKLEQAGWRIKIADDYPYRIADGDTEWWADIEESSGIDWFSFALGVEFEGKRIQLLPTLIKTISMLPDVMSDFDTPEEANEFIESMFEDLAIYHRLEDGRFLPLPNERILPIIKALLELTGPMSHLQIDDGKMRLNPMDAADLAAFEESSHDAQLDWQGHQRLMELGSRLRNLTTLPEVKLPGHLEDVLRPYQHNGVNWLSFLRDIGFGGVLADDMGLGKTLQVLSFILAEKMNGRLKNPILTVAPTSVLPNWKAEIEKFAPSLKVLVWHGPERKTKNGDITNCDIVLTTYPLLSRDKEDLLSQEYDIAILDEAQAIKNAKANVSQAACQLKAECRIALTGTPVENNLGELWALFRFVNPGFLGDQTTFRQTFRTPIEKHGNTSVQSYLSRKVKPFMLRRTKDQVALELPPKTEVIERIELETGQRDLYETIRLMMDKKVRDAISVKGLNRSRIIVLDALLKLRQVCCDPRLLKLDAAKKVKQSAKLHRLLEILSEMVSEGRRILLFSQFTSMLSLIEKELNKKNIEFVKITGNTKDREKPVKHFQSGKVPLFLISLKAGGTGLNLTAADTVIHYDPWWNPAVENQATDRAYRIGQDKPVFVHKLIVSDGVEQAIQDLNKKKAALAEALFSENSSTRFELSEDDLSALFAPLDKAA
ncbi:MAG: DEAD/DEAH box helicase [Pseudomonadota bacterium]